MNSRWCVICRKSYSRRTGINRHNRSLHHYQQFNQLYEMLPKLPSVLKLKIVSFIYPTVDNQTTFWKLLHRHYINLCSYELRFRIRLERCIICHHTHHYDSYEQFLLYISNYRMCMNCVYQWERHSNFMSNNQSMVINNGFVEFTNSNDRSTSQPLSTLKFMMTDLQKFHSRNGTSDIIQFDLSIIHMFNTLDNFIDFIEDRARHAIENVEKIRQFR